MRIGDARIILYVADQARARDFYRSLLERDPVLDVPGMTEFELRPGTVLGLMPEADISQIISPPLPRPEQATGLARCELYLEVDDVDAAYEHALRVGALSVSRPARRTWEHYAGYLADFDGHVIAFARSC